MKRIFFASDLHLCPLKDPKLQDLAYLLEEILHPGDRIYLLGDTFNYWIGPGHLALGEYREVLTLLERSKRTGREIFLIHGNRDYLLGKEIEQVTGIKVLGRSASFTLDTKRVFLTHGDLIYSRGLLYRFYRNLVDLYPIKRLIGLPSPKILKEIGISLIRLSERGSRKCSREIKNLIKPILFTFLEGYDIVICGHLHIAREMIFRLGERICMLYLLADWRDPNYLEYTQNGFRPIRLADISRSRNVLRVF